MLPAFSARLRDGWWQTRQACAARPPLKRAQFARCVQFLQAHTVGTNSCIGSFVLEGINLTFHTSASAAADRHKC